MLHPGRLFAGALSLVVIVSCIQIGYTMAQQTPNLPLPSNITVNIQSPDTDVPAAYAAFVGKWGGYWGGLLPSNLTVERVSASGQAEGVYQWGDHPSGRFRAGATKFRGKIDRGILGWGDTIRFEFKIQPDGKLAGERYNEGTQAGWVSMERIR